MKFYFCETCGKRLTENDIKGGVAKNKKLKGVFCRECAIGVTTMESMPLTDKEAHQVLEAAEPAAAVRPRRPDRRSSSREQRTSKRSPTPPAGKEGRYSSAIILAAAAVVVVAMGGFLALRGQGDPSAIKVKRKGGRRPGKLDPKSTAKKELSETTPATVPKDAPKAKVAAKLQEQAVTRPHPSDPPSPAPKNKTEARFDETPPADSRPDPSPPIQSESHSADPKVSPSTPTQGVQNTDPQTPEKNSEPSKHAAFAAEAARAKRRQAMERHMGALADALRSNDLEAASAVALAIGEDKAMDDAAELSESAAEVVTLLKKIQTDRLKALRSLAGKPKSVILPGGTKPQSVEIGELKDDVLTVRISYLINGEKRFRTNTYPLKDLKEVTWKRLAPTPEPADATGWVAHAILLLASEDKSQLEGVLPKCAGHTLHPFLEQALAKLKLGEKEYAAEVAWKKAERLLNSRQVERAADAYLAFLRVYGDTQTRKRHQKELEARQKDLESQAKVFLIHTKEKSRKISVWNAPFDIPFPVYYRTQPRRKSLRLALFCHQKAKASVSYSLGGAFGTLRFMAGIPNHPGAPVTFAVLGDGKILWTTSVNKKELKPYEVDVKGVDLLTLQVAREEAPKKHDGGSNSHLHRRLIWVNPYLLRFNLPEQLSALVRRLPPSAAPKVGGLKSGTVACLVDRHKFQEITARSVEPRPRTHHNELKRQDRKFEGLWWGYRWCGYIHIPVDGQYTFALDAHDDGRFKLGKQWVVGGKGALAKGRSISNGLPLKAGLYPIKVEMRRPKDGWTSSFHLNLSWKTPDAADFKLIPTHHFFYDPKQLEAKDPTARKE